MVSRVSKEAEVQSCLGFRLFTSDESLGALDLYSHRTDGFTSDDVDNGLALAAQISIPLVAAQNEENLLIGMDSRTVIGQAQGVSMERFHIDAHTAFRALTRFSSSLNIKLHQVARQILETGTSPTRT